MLCFPVLCFMFWLFPVLKSQSDHSGLFRRREGFVEIGVFPTDWE